MSIATPIPGRTNDEHLAKRRRFKIVKFAGAFSLLLLLMYGGFQGRQHASLQARLDEITRVCGQLQQKLDEEQRLSGQVLDGVRGTNIPPRRPPSSNPQLKTFVSDLRMRLEEFDSDYRPNQLSEIEGLENRLNKATLAITEQRFADALATMAGAVEQGNRARTEAQMRRWIRVLQMRGDAFAGLQEWRNALDCYRQVLVLQSDRIVTRARVVDCQVALGRRDEALAAYQELAKSHQNRGDAFLVQRKPDAAIGDYQKAIEIQTRLVEQEGRSELANDLPMSHHHRGYAFLTQGKLDAAIGDFGNAITILTRLVEQEGRSERAGDLAMSHHDRGNALLAQGKPDAAIGDFEKAINLLSRLVGKEGRTELANDLARTHNNRGVARRAQAKLAAAMDDFEKAIYLLTPLIAQQKRSEPVMSDHSTGSRSQVKLEVAMAYSEKSIDALLRTRLVGQGGQRELAVVLAVSLKNRGYGHLALGQPQAAIGDFQKAVEIHARLVEQEGQRDLALEFARSLSPIAWIHATYPDESFRNGNKAREDALKACELSEWRAFVPVETLAAAFAETGSFADAVRWQEKALELAPAKFKADVRSRLEIYKGGKPVRAPLPDAK